VAEKETKKYIEGVGRRKTASARVRIYEGHGVSTANDKPLEEYFSTRGMVEDLAEPLKVVGLDDKYHFSIKSIGGGKMGQADAAKLGLARAIIKLDPEYKAALKAKDFLKRDPRMVERKHPSFRKARKKPQFSKR